MRTILALLMLFCPVLAYSGQADVAAMIGMYSAAGGGGQPFLADTFTTDTTGALTDHSPETGGSWVALGIVASQVFNVGATNDYAWNTGTNGDVYYNNATPPSADYTVTGVVKTASTLADRMSGLCVRMQTDKSGYCVYLRGDGNFILAEYAAGGTTPYGVALDAEVYTISSTTEYTVTISVSGSNLTASIDGITPTLSATDSTISGAGYAGIVARQTVSYVTSISAE